MRPEELKERTKRFGLRVMRLVDALPKTASGRAIGNQLVAIFVACVRTTKSTTANRDSKMGA